ncbi:MAG: nucleotide exchange factor GrpE [Clostridia bacterium]
MPMKNGGMELEMTEEKNINEENPNEDELENSDIKVDNTQECSEKPDKKSEKKDKKKSTKNNELDKAKEEIKELNDKLLRQFAEFDNFRKRTQKERESTFSDAKIKTLSPLVEILDNFERAIETETSDENYKQGIVMIFNQFREKLTNLGVCEMDCLGQKLDPNLHQAVMHIEDPEKGENEIVAVFQKGYMLGDKVLRLSMVQVAN